MPDADPAAPGPVHAPPKRGLPFWSLNKIYWMLYAIPLAAWFAMDGSEMFFMSKDVEHPERAWFKLGVWLFLVNVISLFVWAEDKRRAQRGDWRISEKTLVYLCTLGGLPGALLATRMFHHKSHKWVLQFRLFLVSALLVAFTFFILPHSWSYANDSRWGICLFSLFWWNLAVSQAILRVHSGNRKVLARYLGLLAGIGTLLAGGAAGIVYIFREHNPADTARAAVIAMGIVLWIFNEAWLTMRGLRGKLPGWDPVAPSGAK